MADAFARERQRQLGSLLQRGLEHGFRRGFASALWAAEGSADNDALDVAFELENIIAERSGDHITDGEMVGALRAATVARHGGVPVGVAV